MQPIIVWNYRRRLAGREGMKFARHDNGAFCRVRINGYKFSYLTKAVKDSCIELA